MGLRLAAGQPSGADYITRAGIDVSELARPLGGRAPDYPARWAARIAAPCVTTLSRNSEDVSAKRSRK